MATTRWRDRNAQAKAAGCRCGAPAEAVSYDYGNIGSVPVEFWTCAEHYGATAWSGSEAQYEHPQPCPYGHVGMSGGPINGPTTQWWCPHRTHDLTDGQ